MIYKFHLDIPEIFCVPSRNILLPWSYIKILMAILLFPFPTVPMFELVINHLDNVIDNLPVILAFGAMMTVLIADFVFHSALVAGLHKKSMTHLFVYCNYTKVMLIVAPILCIIYAILNMISWDDLIYRHHFDTQLVTQMYTMMVSLIFQTFMTLVVINEINNLGDENDGIISSKTRVFGTEFGLAVKTTSIEKVIENSDVKEETVTENHDAKEETVTENHDAVEETETNCEETKLTV